MCVGREEQLSEPGAHRVFDVAGESIILVRNREGTLRAFYNVCRHRGARLCRDAHVGARARDWLDLLDDPGDIDLFPKGRRYAPKKEVK